MSLLQTAWAEHQEDAVINGATHGTQRRGRPKVTHVDTLKRGTETTSVHGLVSLMEDRDVWRSLVISRSHPPYVKTGFVA
ncbi:hypothetical protein ElyMa_005354400 [Elysia marginata]|uniref:Uncharacterized protein n=1 Tax=Elysia marginata TaxID=1093978 RepID=A0AAV4EBV7_9GAST|nr:hypothetical protein ElyMa_005354400 [Elysia marginata]